MRTLAEVIGLLVFIMALVDACIIIEAGRVNKFIEQMKDEEDEDGVHGTED